MKPYLFNLNCASPQSHSDATRALGARFLAGNGRAIQSTECFLEQLGLDPDEGMTMAYADVVRVARRETCALQRSLIIAWFRAVAAAYVDVDLGQTVVAFAALVVLGLVARWGSHPCFPNTGRAVVR